jgi:hypothetical protein
MLKRIAATVLIAWLGATAAAYGGAGVPACCLCLDCPQPLPADCTLPFDFDCTGVCGGLGCNDVLNGTVQECTAQPSCPALAAAPAPAAAGSTLTFMVALLVAVAALQLLRQRALRRQG